MKRQQQTLKNRYVKGRLSEIHNKVHKTNRHQGLINEASMPEADSIRASLEALKTTLQSSGLANVESVGNAYRQAASEFQKLNSQWIKGPRAMSRLNNILAFAQVFIGGIAKIPVIISDLKRTLEGTDALEHIGKLSKQKALKMFLTKHWKVSWVKLVEYGGPLSELDELILEMSNDYGKSSSKRYKNQLILEAEPAGSDTSAVGDSGGDDKQLQSSIEALVKNTKARESLEIAYKELRRAFVKKPTGIVDFILGKFKLGGDRSFETILGDPDNVAADILMYALEHLDKVATMDVGAVTSAMAEIDTAELEAAVKETPKEEPKSGESGGEAPPIDPVKANKLIELFKKAEFEDINDLMDLLDVLQDKYKALRTKKSKK